MPQIKRRPSLIRTSFFVAPLALAVAMAVCTWFAARDALYWRQQQQVAKENQLLMTQQLDSVFQRVWERIPMDRQPDTADRETLETWLRFDRKYVSENAANHSLRFERATAHRRIGQICFLLRQLDEAEQNYAEAAALFAELLEENDPIYSYRSELADTIVRTAWVLQARGNDRGRDEACARALALLAEAPIEADDLYNTQSAYTYETLHALALRAGEPARAVEHLRRCQEIFAFLSARSPDNPRYAAEVARIGAELQQPLSQ